MRRYMYLFAMLSLFVIGCSEQSSVLAPNDNANTNEPNWIVSLPSNGLAVNTIHTASLLIDGSKDGHVVLNEEIPGGPFGKIHVDSKLDIFKGSFTGKMTISSNIDDVNLLTTFGPSYVFSKPLEYSLRLEGVDLKDVNPANVKFVYQAADGSIHQCQYSQIQVDLAHGVLRVEKAKIPHFSRYGFVRKRP